jgi:hypothetical protein
MPHNGIRIRTRDVRIIRSLGRRSKHCAMQAIHYGREFKGIVSKLTVKFWMCQKCSKMKDYNNNNKKDYKYCRMITHTLDIMIIITK